MSLFIRCAVVCLASLGIIILNPEASKIRPEIHVKPDNGVVSSMSALSVNERNRVVASK